MSMDVKRTPATESGAESILTRSTFLPRILDEETARPKSGH